MTPSPPRTGWTRWRPRTLPSFEQRTGKLPPYRRGRASASGTGCVRRTARTGAAAAVLFCDLDGFKRINDTGGHAAGDAVLVEVARRLRSVLRAEDSI
ncbi:diguanylate cyclase, partial [Rhodococcus fascians]|nr:diguanylate cyclase [Rhodococcus fascians]